jgi:hypothetical protein
MAAKKYFSNLDLNQNQIKNAVLETVTSASLTTPGTGRIIFDTGSNIFKYYDGTAWQSPVTRLEGQLVYKGSILANADAPESPKAGDVYVFSSAGEAIHYGGEIVEVGDYVVCNGAIFGSLWVVIQGNVVQSSTSGKGIVSLATDEEAKTGNDTAKAIVPSSATAWEDETDRTVVRKRVYTSQTINSSGLTLTHLIGKNDPYVSVYNSSGARVSLEITKGDGTVILTSNVEISGATVVIST